MSEFNLAPDERKALFAGQRPRLIRDQPPQVAAGAEIQLSVQVRITVRSVKRVKAGTWRVEYTLHDDRPRLLRSVPPVEHPGNERDHDPARVHEDSSYTHSQHGTVPDAGEAPPAEYDAVLVARNRERWANHRLTERAEQQAREDARRVSAQLRDRLVSMARQGQDAAPLLAEIQRALMRSYPGEAA